MTRLQRFYAARERYQALRSRLATAVPSRLPTFDRETYLVPEWPMPAAVSPDGLWLASLRDRELFVSDSTGDGRVLTTGALEDTGWDLETVATDPWSPDGRWLFACAVDRRKVHRTARTRFAIDGDVTIDWPRAQRTGTPIDIMRPHFVPVDGGSPVPIDCGDTQDHFIRLIGWLPDTSGAVFARFTRLLDRVDILHADLATGSTRVVMSETSPTFVRHSTVIWTEPVGCWLVGNDRFLWLSSRDGWTHLYRGSLTDGTLTQLTEGAMVVHDVLRWDERHVWFLAARDGARPYDRHLYRVPLDGGVATRLTDGDGIHDIIFDADGGFTDTASTPGRAPLTAIVGGDGVAVEPGEAYDLTPFVGEDWLAPEEVTLFAADGETPLHGLLYRPSGLDPIKRYPLIHWLYGGPQMIATPHRFGPRDDTQVLHHALAEMGYAVFVIDARGTPGRSKAFADTAWRSFAPHVVADQVGALRQLLDNRPWIDPSRIGVMGRSWGAHFALRLLAVAPDLYRAAALVVPGLDPYGGLIYEPYLGLPQVDPAPYRAAEPWDCVTQLAPDARLLLMAGTLDSPCQWDLQRLSRLLVDADIAHHTLTFAEQEHMFFGAAQRFHDRSILDFFDAALA